jgi:hypothetical protein
MSNGTPELAVMKGDNCSLKRAFIIAKMLFQYRIATEKPLQGL